MSEWQPIETAPENEYILIRYYKGGKSYLLSGWMGFSV